MAAPVLLFTSCFTGVESTPRIKEADVRRERADGISAEATFLDAAMPLPPSQWRPGKRFRVVDNRFEHVVVPGSGDASGLKDHDLVFAGFRQVTNLTGGCDTEISLDTDRGTHLLWRVADWDSARVDTAASLAIPFAVDLDQIAAADSIMRGRSFFIRTSQWYTPQARTSMHGLRHIEVRIDSVVPGDMKFEAAAYFTAVDPALAVKAGAGGRAMVFMSLDRSARNTRPFESLFAFDNPRRRYPEIKDDVWSLIVTSTVKSGMTRDECRLALGAPNAVERIPTTAGMAERWTYPNGMYLLFEDGFLTRFRQ